MPNPEANDKLLEKLVLGQLPVEEAERLSIAFANDSRVARLAESVNDTLIESLRNHETRDDSHTEGMVDRVVKRLQSLMEPAGPFSETVALESNAPASDEPVPQQLEYFRVLRVLGRGGMGTVYLADDTRLGRQIALKTLKRELASNPVAKDRFLREARSAARLHHDHIIPIYYVGEADGTPFLAMPFLQGEALDSRLKRVAADDHPLPVPEAIRIARQVAQGLSVAHEQGVIHRDIKPANIWLEAPTGRVKILDFGLARSQKEAANLTSSGAIMGTPAYMAPEQARGKAIDARADLFSLGCVLYEMLTGRRPFSGRDTMAILSSLALDNPAAPETLNPHCSPALADLTMQLLAKDPEQRPATADQVADRLTRLEMPTTAPLESTTHVDPWSDINGPDRTEDLPRPAVTEVGTHRFPTESRVRKRRLLPIVAVGLLLPLIGAGILFGGTIVRVVNNEGELVVTVDDPDTEVAVKNGNVEIRREEDGKKRVFVVKAGKDGEVEVREPGSETVLITRNFRVTRGDKTIVTVTSEQLAAARKPLETDRLAAQSVLSLGGVVRITANGKEGNPTTIAELPRGPFELRIVDWTKNAKLTDAALARLKDCKNLTHLFLQGSPISDVGLAHLKTCTNLTRLNVQKTKVTAAGIAELEKVLPNCRIERDGGVIEPKVTVDPDRRAAEWVLSIGGVGSHTSITVTENGKERQTQELPAGPFQLTGVSLQHNQKVTDAGLANLKDCQNLTLLNLTYTGVGDTGVANFKDCKKLNSLFLPGRVTDVGLANFKNCTDLTSLTLHGCKVTEAGLAYFSHCKKLTALSLTNTEVTDAGLTNFADNPELTKLGLGITKTSAKGLAYFKASTKLQELDLGNTQIADDAVPILKEFKSLLTLQLRKTKVTREAVEELQQALPKCRINWDGGVIEPKGATDPDRRAAEVVLSVSGSVRLSTNPGKLVTAVNELPAGEWKVNMANVVGKPGATDAVVTAIAACQSLGAIYLSNTPVTDAGLTAFKDRKNLVVLELARTAVTDAGLAHFKDHRMLEQLTLSGTRVTDQGLATFGGCKKLIRLLLSETTIGDAGLEHFKDCKNLATLDLKGTRVTDAGLANLRGCNKLMFVHLTGLPIGDAGVANFKDCKDMKEFNLHDTGVSDVGLEHLAGLTSLRTARLKKTKVTEAGVKKLADALPQCKIEWDGGVVEPTK